MNVYILITIRCLTALLVLSVMTKLLGVKHISQMTTFDYIVSIVIGSVGGALCVDTEISLWYCVLAMAILIAFAWLLSFLNRKTVFFRRYVTGTPTVLIDKGKIMYEGLKHIKYNTNDLLRELRHKGYFDISDVEDAIMETNGQVSVLPKSAKRSLTPEDMNIVHSESGLVANVIIDGEVISGNLKAMNRTENWLYIQLQEQEVSLDRILLGTLNGQGELCLYEKDKNKQRRTIVE